MNVPIGHAGLTKAENPGAAIVPSEAAAESNAGQQPRTVHLSLSVGVSLIGGFIIMLTGALYFGKEILLPIALAFMLTLTLSPVVRYLAKFRVPEFVSALLVVVALVGSTAIGIYYLSGPVSGWIDGAPQTGRQIRAKIEAMRAPVDAAVNASKQ